jgi:large subunit ribosomal protein L23
MSVALDPRSVVLRPLVTEKSLKVTERRNAYAFAVDPRANKVQIRRAVEALFRVKVLAVRTDVRKGKSRRAGWKFVEAPAWKRAVVSLKEGDTIQTF